MMKECLLAIGGIDYERDFEFLKAIATADVRIFQSKNRLELSFHRINIAIESIHKSDACAINIEIIFHP